MNSLSFAICHTVQAGIELMSKTPVRSFRLEQINVPVKIPFRTETNGKCGKCDDDDNNLLGMIWTCRGRESKRAHIPHILTCRVQSSKYLITEHTEK